MSSLAQKTSDTRAFLVNHYFPSVLQPCTSRGIKTTSGGFLLAIFFSTSLALDACCSAQVCVDLPDWVSGQPGGRPAAWHFTDESRYTAWLATGNSLYATKQSSSVCAHDTRTVGSVAAIGNARRRVTGALMLREKSDCVLHLHARAVVHSRQICSPP